MDGGDTTRYRAKGINEVMLLDRNEWRKLIHVPFQRNSLLIHAAYPKYLGQMALLLFVVEQISVVQEQKVPDAVKLTSFTPVHQPTTSRLIVSQSFEGIEALQPSISFQQLLICTV